MIVDNDVNILFMSMVPGSYTETRWKKLSFTHGYQRRFAEFPENERSHVSYLSILVANIFFPIIFCHFDEVSVLKSNITTYLIRNFETVIRITFNRILSFYALKGLGLFDVWN